MAREKKPWFPFDAVAFLADLDQAAMTLEECGAYIRLLAWSWREGPLPGDLARLARLLGVSRRKMAALWPALEPCWTRHEDGSITNDRLELERTKAEGVSEKRSLVGAKGAAERWQLPSEDGSKPVATEKQTDAHARVVCVSSPLSAVDPDPGEEPERGAAPLEPTELWDLWRLNAAGAGAPQPSIAGPSAFAHLGDLVRDYTADQLRAALTAWWASPHTGGRNLGLFKAQVGEVLEWLQRSPDVPFRAPRPAMPATRRAIVTDFVARDEWTCPHTPHCASRWRCEQTTDLEEARKTLARAEVHA